MEFMEFLEFINLAIETDRKEKVYMQYCGMLPPLLKYIPFEEFYDTLTGKNIDLRSNEEIIAEIESIHGKVENGT